MDQVGMLVEAPTTNGDSRSGHIDPESPASQHETDHASHSHLESNGQPHPHTDTGSASPPVRQNTTSSVSTMATMASNGTMITLQTVDSPSTPTNDGQAHLNGQVTFSSTASDGTAKKKGGARRRTGPLTEEQRQRAAFMRRLGACDTCRAKRVGCNPSHRGKTWDEAAKEYRDDVRRSRSPLRIYKPLYRERDHGQPEGRQTASPPTSNTESEDIQMGNAPLYQQDARHRLSGGGGEIRINRTPLPSAPGRLDTRASPLMPNLDHPLQGIASRILADPGRGRYKEVHVLMLYWQVDDDVNVKIAVEELARTLADNYNYMIHIQVIPAESGNKSSWTWLSSTMTGFMQQNDQSDVLKIVYYNGHSYLDANKQMVLASSKSPNAQSARWSGLQQILEEACLDTLLLMDAAYYPLSALTRKQGVFELLAAASGADHANQIGRNTFTRALTDLLSRRINQPGDFTASDLHVQLLSSSYPKALEGGAQGRDQEQQLLASFPCPLHLQLSGNARQPSVSLAPVSTHGAQNGTTNGIPGTVPELAVTFRVPADAVNHDSWAEWLRQMPNGIKGIEVDGPYRLAPKA